jgi:hypothetical protein
LGRSFVEGLLGHGEKKCGGNRYYKNNRK